MLIRAMIGQQITVAAARTALTCSRTSWGAGGPGESRRELKGSPRTGGGGGAGACRGGILFPTMAAIAEHGAEVLRGPAARISAITGAAAALADGSLRLTLGDDGEAQRAALLAMPGIGPWTADYVRMRVLGDPDVFLPGDVAARAGAAGAGLPAERGAAGRLGRALRALAQLPHGASVACGPGPGGATSRRTATKSRTTATRSTPRLREGPK